MITVAQPTKERAKSGSKSPTVVGAKQAALATGNTLALRFGLIFGLLAMAVGAITTLIVIAKIAPGVAEKNIEAVQQGRIFGFSLTLFVTIVSAIFGFVLGGKLSSRIRELGQAVQKIGRGGGEVRIRVAGKDEVAGLGRSLQYLASDLTALMAEIARQEVQGGGALATMDQQVRQLRDRMLPPQLPAVAGYEVDGALSVGERGGLDYFDVVTAEGNTVCYLITGEGSNTMSVIAARMARDEVHRALAQGAMPRKALNQANKTLKQNLPAGACAKATLLQLSEDGAKLYQAGARTPLWICQRGEVLELAAEGLALGLDDGPVFEKSLRPQEVAISPGVRLVIVNDAGIRMAKLLELVGQHSSRHTAMFMNMVLGNLEQDAGEGGLREDVVLITAKRAGQV